MATQKGNYSESVQFSGKKRYYVMNAQRNKPLLDAEIREMSNTMLDITRWLARGSYGNVAVLNTGFSDTHASDGVAKRANSFKVVESSVPHLNFKVVGGENSNGVNDKPAIMYLKGWYVFLSTDIEFTAQNDNPSEHLEEAIKEYPSETLPSDTSAPTPEELEAQLSYVTRSDTYTKNVGAPISTGVVGEKDLVYVELTLDEVTEEGTSDDSNMVDPSIKDPIVGTDTSNRLKASVVFKVFENWAGTDPVTGNIFADTFFDDAIFVDNVARRVRAPVALITRGSSPAELLEGNFTDLLGLHSKRVTPPVEISYKLTHGGFTAGDVAKGIVPAIDEAWGATGQNEGVGTEALNSSSVTPRTVAKEGDFRLKSLAVAGGYSDATNETTGAAGETGAEGTIQPDPSYLVGGEITAKKVFLDKLYLADGVTGPRRSMATARGLAESSLVTLDAQGNDGTVLKVVNETGNVQLEVDGKGRLAVGKNVDSFDPDQVLGVLGKSKFDGDAHFTSDIGVTGTATVKELSFDRQSDLFHCERAAGTGTQLEYLALCTLSVPSTGTEEASVHTTLNIASTVHSKKKTISVRLEVVKYGTSFYTNAIILENNNFNPDVVLFDTGGVAYLAMSPNALSERAYSYNFTQTSIRGGATLEVTEDASWSTTVPAGTSSLSYSITRHQQIFSDTYSVNANGMLDLYNNEINNADIAEGYSRGRILDMTSNLGVKGQYLSPAIGGVVWRDAPPLVVGNIAALGAISKDSGSEYYESAITIYVLGYYTSGDGGGGFFQYNGSATGEADAGFSVSPVSGGGLFERLLENKIISTLQYGVINTDHYEDHSSRLLQAIDFAKNNGYTLLIPSGSNSAISDDIVFPKEVVVEIGSGAKFYTGGTSAPTPTVTFKGPTTVKTNSTIVDTDVSLVFYPSALTEVRPEWWGASASLDESVLFDNTAPLTSMYNSLATVVYNDGVGSREVPSSIKVVFGAYIEDSGDFSNNSYAISDALTITMPTEFIGTCGLYSSTTDAVITVQAPIYGGDNVIFSAVSEPSFTTYVIWETSTKVNARWFWNGYRDLALGRCNLAANFYLQEVLITFPGPFEYSLISHVDSDLTYVRNAFGEGNTLEFQKGAVFNGDRVPVSGSSLLGCNLSVHKVVDNGHFKYKGVNAPYIGNSIIKTEWFEVDGVSEDETVRLALGALTRRAKVQDGTIPLADRLEYLRNTTDLSTPPPKVTLDGGGKTYTLTSSLAIPSGNFDGTQATSQGMVIKNLTLQCYSSFIFSGSESNNSLLVDLTVQDSIITIPWPIVNINDYRELMTLNSMFYVNFNRCQFANGFVDTGSSTDISNITFTDCSMQGAFFSLVNAEALNLSRCRFTSIDGFVSDVLYLLELSTGGKADNCMFTSKDLSDGSSKTKLGKGVLLAGPDSEVTGCYFYDTDLNVEYSFSDGDYSLMFDHFIISNRFEASFGQATGVIIDTFIKLTASASGHKMQDILVTGNTFTCFLSTTTNLALSSSTEPYVSAYNLVWEAINVIEEGTFAFDDNSIVDVVVKDNIAHKSINVRGTEVTESRAFNYPSASNSVSVPIGIPTASFGGIPTHKRLVGIPREIKSWANLTYDSTSWVATSVRRVTGRYDAISVLGRYSLWGDPETISMGYPTNEPIIVYISFKMYERATEAFIGDYSIYPTGNVATVAISRSIQNT